MDVTFTQPFDDPTVRAIEGVSASWAVWPKAGCAFQPHGEAVRLGLLTGPEQLTWYPWPAEASDVVVAALEVIEATRTDPAESHAVVDALSAFLTSATAVRNDTERALRSVLEPHGRRSQEPRPLDVETLRELRLVAFGQRGTVRVCFRGPDVLLWGLHGGTGRYRPVSWLPVSLRLSEAEMLAMLGLRRIAGELGRQTTPTWALVTQARLLTGTIDAAEAVRRVCGKLGVHLPPEHTGWPGTRLFSEVIAATQRFRVRSQPPITGTAGECAAPWGVVHWTIAAERAAGTAVFARGAVHVVPFTYAQLHLDALRALCGASGLIDPEDDPRLRAGLSAAMDLVLSGRDGFPHSWLASSLASLPYPDRVRELIRPLSIRPQK